MSVTILYVSVAALFDIKTLAVGHVNATHVEL